MNLYYIVNSRMPTEKAYGYQIAKMCEEFARAGAHVELWVPTRRNEIAEDVFSFYGLEKNFQVVFVPCFDAIRYESLLGDYLGRYVFWLQSFLFRRALAGRRGSPLSAGAIIYTRNPDIASMYSRKGYRMVYDAHNFPQNHAGMFLKMLKGASGIVCNSKGTAREFSTRGFPKVLVAPNAVDLKNFAAEGQARAPVSAVAAARKNILITYVGHLYAWKGIDVVIESARLLRERKDLVFQIIGGTQNDVKKYARIIEEKQLSNVRLLGYKPKTEIPAHLRASDILLLPNVPVSKESSEYTSPLKMFEYMASGVPIIASDLPSLREVLNEQNAFLCKAGDAEALSRAIERVISDRGESAKRAARAADDVKRYTWDKRAKLILDFIA